MAETMRNDVLIERILKDTQASRIVAENIILDVVREYQNRAANYFQKEQFGDATYDTGRGFEDLGDGESAAYGLMRAIWAYDTTCKARVTVMMSEHGQPKERLDLQCEREMNHELSSVDAHKSGDYEWVSSS